MIPLDQLVQLIVINLSRTKQEAIIIHSQKELRAFLIITGTTIQDKLEYLIAKPVSCKIQAIPTQIITIITILQIRR